MENPLIINLMRSMMANAVIDLESVHRTYNEKTKFYRGRPEMIVMTMKNGRRLQMFRKGKIQLLGCIPRAMAEDMRCELIEKLKKIEKMENFQVTEWMISNMVVSVQLTTPKVFLRNYPQSDFEVFYEAELFPAVLIRKWHPIHIALFHNGKVILTGLKSVETVHRMLSILPTFFNSHFSHNKK